MSITIEEYEKLMSFAAFINADYERFSINVVNGLEQFFQFSLSVYSVFRRDSENNVYVDHILGHSIYPDGLNRYKDEYWKSDLFVQRIDPRQQGRMQRHVITISDIASYDEFYATDYGKYLIGINTPYQATLRAIRSHSLPLHVLCVFKTKEQGEFTPHEIELLSKIGQLFSEGVDHYIRFISGRFFSDFLQAEAAAAQHNLAIVDEHGDVIFSTPSFSRLSLECFGLQGGNGLVQVLRQLLKERLRINFFSIVSSVKLRFRNFDITVAHHCYKNHYLGQFYFIFIDRADGTGEELSAQSENEEYGTCDLVEEYGFTPREAEIAQLLTAGMSSRQMAESLYISLPTVKFHIQNICKKLDVSSRTAAIAKLLNSQKSEL